MRAEELLAFRDDLGRFLNEFDVCATKPTRKLIGTYVRGQLGPLQRKSVEPMALDAQVAPRTLQELLSLHRWDEDLMLDRVQKRVQRSHGGRGAIMQIDETSHVKKGDKTPGVQRQYCGTMGKQENCVVTVHASLSDADFHALLDADLYLPESWAVDVARRKAARIPKSVQYRPKYRIALDLVDHAMGNGVEFGWAVFDEGYTRFRPFLEGLRERGVRYVGEAPTDFLGWALKTPPVVTENKAGAMGRPPHLPRVADGTPKPITVKEAAALIDKKSRLTYVVKDTHKGPEVWHIGAMPFFPVVEGLPTTAHWLVVMESAATGEVKYFVSNASPGVPLEVIVHVAFSRWHIERCFQDDKGEIGLDHFEVRNYLSLKRHLILSTISFLFLAETNERLRGGKSGVDDVPDQGRRRSTA